MIQLIGVITIALVTPPNYAVERQLMQAGMLLLCSFWHAQPIACNSFMFLIPFFGENTCSMHVKRLCMRDVLFQPY